MAINLYEHQKKAIETLQNGNILCGGVGSGKSRTALGYYFFKVCDGGTSDFAWSPMKKEIPLYIITTARKRDTFEWLDEANYFLIKPEVVDSWNNLEKYLKVKDAFFIFDEQRVVGKGAWVKWFLKITKNNKWILLSATPGDTWTDYIPVFIANGFYKNRSDFHSQHVIFSRFTKFPKVDHYVNTGKLIKRRNQIVVKMHLDRETTQHHKYVYTNYDKGLYIQTVKNRWNIYKDAPCIDMGEVCQVLRRICNSDEDRLRACGRLLSEHSRAIVFYNFNYELEALRGICGDLGVPYGEWNGHLHQGIPGTDKWVYLVQYNAGAEGWNCTSTDTIIFFSQNYSYKIMTQAAGRIDRMNTSFKDLYYYHLISESPIDKAILFALRKKKNFNEMNFVRSGRF